MAATRLQLFQVSDTSLLKTQPCLPVSVVQQGDIFTTALCVLFSRQTSIPQPCVCCTAGGHLYHSPVCVVQQGDIHTTALCVLYSRGTSIPQPCVCCTAGDIFTTALCVLYSRGHLYHSPVCVVQQGTSLPQPCVGCTAGRHPHHKKSKCSNDSCWPN